MLKHVQNYILYIINKLTTKQCNSKYLITILEKVWVKITTIGR